MRKLSLVHCRDCQYCKKSGSVVGGRLASVCGNEQGLKGYLNLQEDKCQFGKSVEGAAVETWIHEDETLKLPLGEFIANYLKPDTRIRLADITKMINTCGTDFWLRPSVKVAKCRDILDPKHKWHKYLDCRVTCILGIDQTYENCLAIQLYVPEGY